MNNITQQALELIGRHAEGLATAAESQELETLMRANPELVELHVKYFLLDDALVNRARETEGAVAQRNDAVVTPRPRQSTNLTVLKLMLVSVAMVLLGVAVFWRTDTSSTVRAIVVDADNLVLEGHTNQITAGESIDLGRIALQSGRLEVELESGVRLEMIAPFAGILIDSMQLRLLSGRLNADVGQRGQGFTVRTDAGDVIDLGTRFGIEADAGGECRVAVFSGEVELRPRCADGATEQRPTVRLTEGQAARFSALAGLRQWREVALAAKAAGISSQPYAGVVATIQDNLGTEKLHPFYGLVQGGMRSGAVAYTDKPRPAWWAVEGGKFPAFLEGADLIRTYHQFRWKRNYRLRLELRSSAEIFVLRDVREDAPNWLKSEFTDTGVRLRVGPWHPQFADEPGVLIQKGEPYLIAAVWRRVADAGVVELGSARADDGDALTIMYGLAVKPLSIKP
ncbi:FecR domain-containing protein [Thalassoroseus pseudoceratinae]|uniref:FecR domain-containing protein n=1 Tax=Thalassoroseus pseudoceratinae TaxID=2713176 RepID=UPI00142431E5|nr:FecR family protein [Thalassoroseus pseudoceratinae]